MGAMTPVIIPLTIGGLVLDTGGRHVGTTLSAVFENTAFGSHSFNLTHSLAFPSINIGEIDSKLSETGGKR
jgi:hypothetical protein